MEGGKTSVRTSRLSESWSEEHLQDEDTRTSAGAGSAHTSVQQGAEARTSCCSEQLSSVQHVDREEVRVIVGIIPSENM